MIRWALRTKECPNIFKDGRTFKNKYYARSLESKWMEYFRGLYCEPVEVMSEEESLKRDFENCSEELKEAIFKLEQYRDLILEASKIMDSWVYRTQLDSDDIHEWKLKSEKICKIVGDIPPKKS